jgi:hypothetical protein
MRSALAVRLFVVGLAAAMLALPIGGALAAKPQRFSFEVHDEFLRPDLAAICGFDILHRLDGTVKGKDQFDAAGNFTGAVVQIHLDGSFTNVENGKSVPFIIRATDHVTANADGSVTVATSGIAGRAVVPGQGLVGATIGRTVLTFPVDGSDPILEFEAGQNNEQELFVEGGLCDLLA